MDQIRNAIQGLKIEHDSSDDIGVLTASFGFVIIENYEGLTPERVYKIADGALYRAKASNRNCVDMVNI